VVIYGTSTNHSPKVKLLEELLTGEKRIKTYLPMSQSALHRGLHSLFYL